MECCISRLPTGSGFALRGCGTGRVANRSTPAAKAAILPNSCGSAEEVPGNSIAALATTGVEAHC